MVGQGVAQSLGGWPARDAWQLDDTLAWFLHAVVSPRRTRPFRRWLRDAYPLPLTGLLT